MRPSDAKALAKADAEIAAKGARRPTRCPRCGSKDLAFGLPTWFAHSLEPGDLHNTAEIEEYQCHKCGVAFWM